MENKDKLELYERARLKWGTSNQMLIAVEECSELQKEILKNIRGNNNLAEITEEIADVEITIEQIKEMWGLDNIVDSIKERKLNRLKERVENNDY